MDNETAMGILSALGIKITMKSEVTDGIRSWGFMSYKGNKLFDQDARMYDLEEYDAMSLGDDHVLHLLNEEKDVDVRVPAGMGMYVRMSEDDDFKIIDNSTSEPRQIPTTTATLMDVFDELLPDWYDHMYYDVLREREMIDMVIFDKPEEGVVAMSDLVLAIYHDYLERRLYACGFVKGRLTSRATMDEVLSIMLRKHCRNPFLEWVESIQWDGKPRLRSWFIDKFKATAPALTAKEERKYLEDVSQAWFLGTLERQYKETVLDIVPVILGRQGLGKSRAIKYTAGQERWYKDTNVDVAHPDRFLDSVRGRVVVELAEVTQFRNSDAETMKAFISQSADQYRKPYARYDETFVRHFSLIGTSNMSTVFTDITGNRRYFPMYCYEDITEGLDDPYDAEQVWAEAFALYHSGASWRLDATSRVLGAKMQEYASVDNEGISSIDSWLDDPVNGYSEVGDRVCRQIIVRDMFNQDIRLPPSADVKTAWRAWTNGTRNWKKLPGTVRINGMPCRGFERVFKSGEDPVSVSMREVAVCDMDDEIKVLISKFKDMYEHMELECGDCIPVEDVPAELLDSWLDIGLIYNAGLLSKPDYRFGVMP